MSAADTRLAGVGDDEVQAAVGRHVLDRATEVGVQPADAEHQVLDDLLLVADLELLVVHALAGAGPRVPAVRPVVLVVEVDAPLGRLAPSIDAVARLAADRALGAKQSHWL